MPPTPATESAFTFIGLTKIYRLYSSPGQRLVEALTGRPRHAEVRALDGISGEVPKGSVIGLIGENGSGKSTLLKILAGTTEATAGQVTRSGRIASILELGSSFHPEVTGRGNVVLQAALMGLSRKEVEAAIPEVEAFAELGDFFDRPVKTYSSGMTMRLAFAAATAVLPDTVILDEALAVGDGHFQKKCVDRIFELKESGRTILFCSHAMYYVSTLCDRVIWLDRGSVASTGPAHQVVMEYESFLARKGSGRAEEPTRPVPQHGPAQLLRVTIVGADGKESDSFRPGGPWGVEVEFAGDTPDRPLHLHIGVATHDQVNCFSADSRVDGTGPFRGQPRWRVRVDVPSLPLSKGEFIVNTFLTDETGLALYDAKGNRPFRVDAKEWKTGLFEVPVRWTVEAVARPGAGG